MSKILILALLALTGCASSMADNCVSWKKYDEKFEFGFGTLIRKDINKCMSFRE